MSKLARALTLTAILAAISLVPLPAVAQTHAADHATSQDAKRTATQSRATSPQQAAADTAHRRLLAQDRSYSTQGSSDRSAPAPTQPSRLVIALSVLVAVGVLLAGGAVLAARRALRGQRAGQTA
jgi:Flp pilus assembly protein TadB